MKREYKIDYLTLTLDSKELVLEMLPPVEDIRQGNKWYQGIYRTFGDGIVMLNETGSRQGNFVSFGGKAIAYFKEANKLGELLWIGQRARNVTRIDLAIDIMNKHDRGMVPMPETFYKMHKERRCQTHARERQLVLSGKTGDESQGKTVYIGSKKSEKLLRIYDKAAELKVPDWFWTRFELQCRGSQAEAKFKDCVEKGVANAAYNAVISFVNFGSVFEWLIEPSIDSDIRDMQEFTIPGRKDTSIERYLEQLEKTILNKASKSEEDWEKIAIFWDKMFRKLEKSGEKWTKK